MNRIPPILWAILVLAVTAFARAEIVFEDDLLYAYKRAGKSIAAGEQRDETLVRLQQAIERHPQSPHLAIAKQLAWDLQSSIGKQATRANAGTSIDEAPAQFLSESQLPLALLAFPENWERPLQEFMAKHPRDPAVLVFKQGREAIDSLLPQLRDNSPTRAFDVHSPSGGVPEVPRVADLALNLIEAITQCKFQSSDRTPSYFHKNSTERRSQKIEHLTEWWNTNKDKSLLAGIRAQLPHAGFYDQIKMAQNLIRASSDDNPQDREHGMDVLRKLARSADDQGASAALALAEFGDFSPLDAYHAELSTKLPVWRSWHHCFGALSYLAEYGGRKEWELLYEIVGCDVSAYWYLLSSRSAASSPYAIPLVGRELSHRTSLETRWIERNGQSLSRADQALERLQNLSGVNFAYRADAPPHERAAAIARARKWWDEEGKAKYTFEFIERNLIQRAPPD